MGAKSIQFFDKPITEVIKSRISVRTYKDQSLTDDIKGKLRRFMREVKGPFDTRYRLMLVDRTDAFNDSGAKLGTYGVIKGASTFLVSAIDRSNRSPEQLGFVFEQLLLYATSIGLGTCWLGGTFKKSEFANAIGLKDDEILPIVSPVGFVGEKRALVDTMLRFGAGSNSRKNWEALFYNGSFDKSLSELEAGRYSTPLEMVRLGPSASNKQPWRIVKEGDTFHFYLQRTKGYGNILSFDIQRLDIGIAMCHFQLSAEEQGLTGKWTELKPVMQTLPENTEYIISWVGINLQ